MNITTKTGKNPFRLACLGAVMGILAAGSADASIIYSGSGTAAGNAVSASAIFDITGNDLTITLINTSASIAGQDSPGSTLSGLFWDFTGNPFLTPFSATVAAGSIVQDPCNIVSCVGVNQCRR